MSRRARIVATLGPATRQPERLTALIEAGMDVGRLNFSHGTHEEHAATIQAVRQAAQCAGRPVTILQDLQGPKLRTGPTVGGRPIRLEAGQSIQLTSEPGPSTPASISISCPTLARDLRPGARVLLRDGEIQLQVVRIEGDRVMAEITAGADLGPEAGVHFPGLCLSSEALTEKDLRDLAWGLKHDIDAVALSFVRRPGDVRAIREVMAQQAPGPLQPWVIAKIERADAIEELPGILAEADGVIVARGDLDLDVSSERVPSLQKHIIREANAAGKIVVTATQMLESMIHSPRPTRAEVSDVANAVFDGSDALMLSGETAVGDYPVQAVEVMDRIIVDAEDNLTLGRPDETAVQDDAEATARAARALAADRDVAAIAVFTRSGRTAQLMAKTRPPVPILAFTPEQRTLNRLNLCWGVEPHEVPLAVSVEAMLDDVERVIRGRGRALAGQQIILVASHPLGAMGPANFSLLHTLRS
jgi:pyruvate kinase